MRRFTAAYLVTLLCTMILLGCATAISDLKPEKQVLPQDIPLKGEVYGKFAVAIRPQKNEDFEIYVIEANGKKAHITQLTNNDIEDMNPRWSPDGKKIAFIRGIPRTEDMHIWVMDTDGSNQKQVVKDRTSWSPTWSPDGTKIAYTALYKDKPDAKSPDGLDSDIHVINIDGTNDKRLTNDPTPEETRSWSKDGLIVLTYGPWTAGKGEEGWFNTAEVYVMKADGANKRGLTNNKVADIWPIFSPDGKKVAFTSNRDDNGNPYPAESAKSRICIMDSGGANVNCLPMNYDAYVDWSPDGTKFAAISFRSGKAEVWIMDIDGSNQILLTPKIYWTEDIDWFPIQ